MPRRAGVRRLGRGPGCSGRLVHYYNRRPALSGDRDGTPGRGFAWPIPTSPKPPTPTANHLAPGPRGPLQPRGIEATQTIRIGKEANRLTESPDLVIDDSDRAITFREGSACDQCGQALSGRQRRWCSGTVSEAAPPRELDPKTRPELTAVAEGISSGGPCWRSGTVPPLRAALSGGATRARRSARRPPT